MVPRSFPSNIRTSSHINRQRSKSFAEWSLSQRNGSVDDDQSSTDDDYLKYYQYLEKRKRNNEAAKRSREKRRLNDILMESRLQQLAHENTLMKTKLDSMKPNPFSMVANSMEEPVSPTNMAFLGAINPFGYPNLETSFSLEQPCPLPNATYDGLGSDLSKPLMFFPSPQSYYHTESQTLGQYDVDQEYYKIGRRRSLLLPKVSLSDTVPYSYFFHDPLAFNTKQYLRIKLLEKRCKSNPCLFQTVPSAFDDAEKVDPKHVEQLMMDSNNDGIKIVPKEFCGKIKVSHKKSSSSHFENKFQKICLLQNENNKLKNVMLQLSQEVAALHNMLV